MLPALKSGVPPPRPAARGSMSARRWVRPSSGGIRRRRPGPWPFTRRPPDPASPSAPAQLGRPAGAVGPVPLGAHRAIAQPLELQGPSPSQKVPRHPSPFSIRGARSAGVRSFPPGEGESGSRVASQEGLPGELPGPRAARSVPGCQRNGFLRAAARRSGRLPPACARGDGPVESTVGKHRGYPRGKP